MISVKISSLLNSTETLQKLANMKLKAKLSWQVSRLLKEAEREIQEFNEARLALINKYGEKDENGELVTDEKSNCKIDNEFVKEFSNELEELVSAEVELNASKIDINKLEELDFTPSEMIDLEPFIEMEE